MKLNFTKKAAFGCIVALSVLAACDNEKRSERQAEEPEELTLGTVTDSTCNSVRETGLEPGMQALLDAYPESIKEIRNGRLLMSDGTEIVYNDGRKKEYLDRLDDSDPEDMFFDVYDSSVTPPAYLSDPGRSRSEQLFKHMYGKSAGEVERNLATVDWFGSPVKFTSVNGAAKHLQDVAREIAGHPELRKWVDCSGTFYWRAVRGAKRQSAHSYGIAIDIAVKNADYWLWKNPGATETDKVAYANKIPRQLVDIFERHGFIWGGAWYHYDTMHFEYRPEILRYAEIKGR